MASGYLDFRKLGQHDSRTGVGTVPRQMEITPRPFGELLSEGVTVLTRVWLRLLAPAFWAFVALGGLTIAVFAVTGSGDFLRLILNDPGALDQLTDEELLEPASRLLFSAVVAIVLQLLAAGFVNLVAHRIVASDIAGIALAKRQVVSSALSRLVVLAVAGFIAIVSIIIGLAAFVVPGVWLAGSVSMLSAVIALEDLGPVAALRRSFELVRGRWWATVGFLILVGLLGSAAAQLVQLIALPVLASGDLGLGAGLGFVFLIVVQGMIVAAIAVMTTVWYIDLRARKESLLTTTLT